MVCLIHCLGGRSLGLGLRPLAEAVLEPPGKSLHVPHAACTGRLAADGLLPPLVGPLAGSGVAARRADVLLVVVAGATATNAQRVRLVATLTKASGTLALLSHFGVVLPI
ncbi:hypothetical protein Vafri_1260, partial [Volvox africanus]